MYAVQQLPRTVFLLSILGAVALCAGCRRGQSEAGKDQKRERSLELMSVSSADPEVDTPPGPIALSGPEFASMAPETCEKVAAHLLDLYRDNYAPGAGKNETARLKQELATECVAEYSAEFVACLLAAADKETASACDEGE